MGPPVSLTNGRLPRNVCPGASSAEKSVQDSKDEGGGRRYESEELARARRSKPARRTPTVLLRQGAPHRVPPHHANAPAVTCVLSAGSGTPGVSATFITPSRWW